MKSEPMLTPKEKSPLPKADGRVEIRRCIRQDSEPNTLPTELLRPPEEFCLLVAYRPSNMRVYLRDGSAQTILRAATQR